LKVAGGWNSTLGNAERINPISVARPTRPKLPHPKRLKKSLRA
jgi:hypothetical protein